MARMPKMAEGIIMTKNGARVGAIRNADTSTVYLFGYGIYDGDFEPPSLFGQPIDEWKAEAEKAMGRAVDAPLNPRITLDDGGVVWGNQCWWGPEEQIKKKISKREVVIVSPPRYYSCGEGKELRKLI